MRQIIYHDVFWSRVEPTDGNFDFTDSDAADTANYVRLTVARYRDRARFWEVANEINGVTTRPRGLPVAEFAEFLQLTRGWVRAEDPQAQIVLPGLLGTYGFPFSNSTNWLNQLLVAGGGIWVVRFQTADDITRHVMWSPDGGSHPLTDITAGARLVVTGVVPTAISPDGHNATFETSYDHAPRLRPRPLYRPRFSPALLPPALDGTLSFNQIEHTPP